MNDEQFDRDTINENHEMSTQTKDGGKAFPRPDTRYPNGEMEYGSVGMTLRDWFAGQALAGSLAACTSDYEFKTSKDAAKEAYDKADAMIAAREGVAK